MKRFVFFLGLLLWSGFATAQAPVPVSQEPRHHFKAENEFLRVFDVVVPAGDTTLFHIHDKDYAYVALGDAVLKAQLLGKDEQDLKLRNGDVGFTKATITHRVRNVGQTPFHNLTIEFLKPAGVTSGGTPEPVAAPQSLVLENERMRVIRMVLKPGESTGIHSHLRPGIGIAVSAGSIRVQAEGQPAEERQVTPGFFSLRDHLLRHTITNVGKTSFESIDIEVK